MKTETIWHAATGMLRHVKIATSAHKGRTLITLLMMLLTTATAGAQTTESVKYIDENGDEQTVTATVLTGSENSLLNNSQTNGWFVVNSNISYTGRQINTANVNIILKDNCTMTMSKDDGTPLYLAGNLTIYGQSGGTGKLVVNSSWTSAIEGNENTFTVNGGIVEAKSTDTWSYGLICGSLVFNGGKLKLEGCDGVKGKSNTSQSVTLNWRNATDRVYISSFNNISSVTVGGAGGKCFADADGNYYGGTYTSNFSALAGKELQPATAHTLTLGSGVTTTTEPLFTNSDVDYYVGTVTLGHADRTGYLFNGYTVNGTAIDGNTFTITADATVAAAFATDPAHFELTATDEYTIHTAEGWGVFCDALQDNDTYNRFSGKTVKLDANIGTAQDPITRMAGSDGHDFCGTFDGDGKTLTVNYTNTGNNVMTAPFSYVNGATIQNLIVGGTISGTAYRAAGIVGETTGQTTITNCVSSVDISSGRYTGGISIGGLVTITGCVFDGKIVGTDKSGGFVGFSNTATAISNSLFAPQDGSSISGGTFYYNGGGDITPTNSYYTRTLGDAQGKQAHSITAGENVTVANAGTPETVYTVSGITAYTTGIKYNDVLYAGSGDAVSLTLSNTATSAPAGYQYDGYTASAGTLDDNNILTMPDEDVTVSVNTAILTVLPWTGDGSEGNPYIIYNKDQLDLLAYRVNGTHGETLQEDGYSGKYFKLNNDISYPHTSSWNDFTSDESNYEAIGGYYGGNRSFSGHFDGNNKTISGIRINKDGYKRADRSQAIFGWTDYGADIHNLTLADARITGHYYTGGIVGYNDGGTVTRCHVAGDVAVCAVHVQPGADYHGGIVGNNNWGIIEQCTSAATLTTANATSTQNYGGIAGRNSGTLSDNLAIGATVPAAANNTYGAITGYNGGTLQRNYYAACKVADTENATGVGCGYISDGNGGYTAADVTDDNGAVCINTLTLAANQAPDGNFWTTYYNSALGFTIDADENACAYTAEYDGANSQLTLHKLGKVIPKQTAVILVGSDNSISMTASTDAAEYDVENDLRGEDVRTSLDDIKTARSITDGTFYVMGKVGDVFGFYQYTAQYMPARKAYLLIADSSAPSLTMVFDNETTEIKTTDFTDYTDKADTWYSLDGRKLDKQPTAKGIYIHNGRKVVIK